MTKEEKINEYIKKVMKKHDLTEEKARALKLTQEYIKWVKSNVNEEVKHMEIEPEDRSC